jgi:hypothetical protein
MLVHVYNVKRKAKVNHFYEGDKLAECPIK